MTTAKPWCLVLAIWGQAYGSAHVNEIARAARRLSPGLRDVVLVTGPHPREGIDPDIWQVPFPAFFAQPAFFGGRYRAKLAIFSREVVPPGRVCIYLDLDSVVTGDLGRIAELIASPEDFRMMPPAGLGFGRLRRLVDLARGDRHYPVGNSSVVAFHADATPNIAAAFQSLHEAGTDPDARHMHVDDVFISWLMRGRVRPVPDTLAVSFRREFMARAWPLLWLRLASSARRKRREGLAVITFNGPSVKPEQLVALPDGGRIGDRHGRRGKWSDAYIGPVRSKIIASASRLIGK